MRQFFLETYGTLLHGKHVCPQKLVWAIGALAEGLGIRAVARLFEVEPDTVLQWLVEATDQSQSFAQFFLHGWWNASTSTCVTMSPP